MSYGAARTAGGLARDVSMRGILKSWKPYSATIASGLATTAAISGDGGGTSIFTDLGRFLFVLDESRLERVLGIS